MAISDRNLKAGATLVVKYKKHTYTAAVLDEDGGTDPRRAGARFRLEDGRSFKSPSAAGTAITGKACNGWAFWSLQGEEKPKGATGTATVSTEPTTAQDAPHEPQGATGAPTDAPDTTNPHVDGNGKTWVTIKEEGPEAGAPAEATTPADQPTDQPTEPVAEQPAPETGETAETGGVAFRRVPNQKGVAEGQTRWHCPACAKSFTAPAGQEPGECPRGHKAG